MKTIITSILLAMTVIVIAQTKYEKAMDKAFTEWDSVKTSADLLTVSQSFDRVAKVEKDKWLPLYYVALSKSLYAFSLEKKEALTTADELLSICDSIATKKDYNSSELKTLKALILTVKVAKDPMTYGQSLSPTITQLYQEAIKENSNNPRPVYLNAQYQMGGAKFWGKDPKDYCSEITQSITLFEAEKPGKYEPKWGIEQAKGIQNTTCKIEEKPQDQ